MNEPFVPFGVMNAAAKASEPFRGKIVSAQDAAEMPFRAFASTSATAHSHSAAHGQPHVSVTRDGDKITTIRVICGCGEVMELKCAY